MTRLIELPQIFEEIAAARAQRNGQSLEEYLPELIATALAQPSHSVEQNPENREARIQRFRRWAESNGHDTPFLPDEAISREAIYSKS